MKPLILSLLTMFSAAALQAQNKATAAWIPESEEIANGKALRTVVRMNVDKGWHTYWENPGEGGLPLEIKAELPEDWILGEIQYPAPKRFMTGELPGFGYEGEVLFPVTITPAADASGKSADLKAKLVWLTCDDESCLPGDAELVPTKADPALVAAAFDALPKEIPGAKLVLLSADQTIEFALTLPADSKLNPTDFKVFPATRNIVDPAAVMKFEKDSTNPNRWLCSAPKSEYLSDTPNETVLVFVDGENRAWKLATDATLEVVD